MVDIGTLGGNSSYALGINDDGEVTGWSYLADNVTYHAFTWTQSGGMLDLGTLGGCCSKGLGINSSGNVAGDVVGTDVTQSPFFWSSLTGMVSLGEFNGDQFNFAFSVNDHNQMTGQIYAGQVVHAFLWSKSAGLQELGHLPGGLHSVGIAINNSNVVVGAASTSTGAFTSMIWTRASGMQDLGILPGGTYTAAQSINDNTEVAGWGYLNPQATKSRAFYWSQGTNRKLLAALGGDLTLAFGISQTGVIAGYSELAGNSATHAVIWNSFSSTPTDLGTLPGGTNSYARALNNVGQVVGYADVP